VVEDSHKTHVQPHFGSKTHLTAVNIAREPNQNNAGFNFDRMVLMVLSGVLVFFPTSSSPEIRSIQN